MIDRIYLEEMIEKKFPDLKNTDFICNNIHNYKFTEQSLVPFLVYQNTTDTDHRLIGLYLPEASVISNLVPIYIIMGHYRKALDRVMTKYQYQNKFYVDGSKQVVINGGICNITAVDFLSRQLICRAGMGRTITVPFSQRNSLKWYYKSATDILEQINLFVKKDKAANGNIFSFPFTPDDKHHEGVIIFTNTSKFESLIRNVQVSGTDLRDHVNIEKVVFPLNEGRIKFVSLSRPKTRKKPVSLLIARHDSFRAYKAIIEAGSNRLNHIRTIVIDDFDDLISQWERSDTQRKEVSWLEKNYFRLLQEGQLQDLYLVSRNSSIYNHNIFKEAGIDYHPWLLGPLEEMYVNEKKNNYNFYELSITMPVDSQYENLQSQLNGLIDKWRLLAQHNYCNGEILGPFNSLYDLRRKINSFFDPTSLWEWKDCFLANIFQLQTRWFSGGQDHHLIEETQNFIYQHLGEHTVLTNFKLQTILDELGLVDVEGYITIVSENNSYTDSEWLSAAIQSHFPSVEIIFLHKKDTYMLSQGDREVSQIIFYLTADPRIIGMAAGNGLAEKQIFILNRRACDFTERYLEKFQRIQKETGDDQRKYNLLNIGLPPKPMRSDAPAVIPVNSRWRNIGLLIETENTITVDEELQDVVVEILEKHHGKSAGGNSGNYVLLFDDGTIIESPGSRHFFLYDDDKQYNDSDIINLAADLKSGNQIILAKRGVGINQLMQKAMRKNSDYCTSLEMDDKWRILLHNHINRSGMDVDFFCSELSAKGFDIGPTAVKNWIDGATRRPDRFQHLLRAMNSLNIIHGNDIEMYDKCNSNLKSMQIRFVRIAIPRLIARLKGLKETSYDENGIFDESLLNDFIQHIEIKRVSATYRI